MWLVRLALRRSYTIIVMAMLIVVSGVLSIRRMPTDIFPNIDIPVVSVIFNYGGLPPQEMESRIVSNFERFLTTTVNDIEHIESQTLFGIAVIKIFLQEGASVDTATAQVTAVAQTAVRSMPPGATPPLIMSYSATNVPILQAALESETLGEQELFDLANSFIRLAGAVRRIPGAVDVRVAQVEARPQVRVHVDRTLASESGLSERDVASDLLVSLSSSGQVSPAYWVDARGVQYLIAVQSPQYEIDSIDALRTTPLSTNGRDPVPQLLSNVATFTREGGPINVTHYNVARTYDVQADVQGTDLGSVADEIELVLEQMRPSLPQGTSVTMKGQIESMQSSFRGLSYGLLFAVLLVYLLMVVNFQSWLDPVIVLTALPGAVAGITWMLLLTGTTVSVPALMGAIMCVGVATSNAVLLLTFANDRRAEGYDARDAALAAGMTRIRPVLMTALAMILGMLPMSFGLGEGGEQNLDRKGFARVVAPYSGVIVARSSTRGALVSAGPTTPLFRIAATDPVRVMVAVPQDIAPSIETGESAELVVRELGSQKLVGLVARTSNALDAATRTMLVEVRVPNANGRLITGMAVKVGLQLAHPHPVLEIPGTAVIVDALGVRVAVVDDESKIRFSPIVIERDTGTTVLVSNGLTGAERVVAHPSSALVEGAPVSVEDAPEPTAER